MTRPAAANAQPDEQQAERGRTSENRADAKPVAHSDRTVIGMTCAACVGRIEKALQAVPPGL